MGRYYSEESVAALTAQVVESGERLLQIFHLADTEAEHAKRLAAEIGFCPGDTIIDAGCGTGALAGYLRELEPSLRLHLLNISPAQLAYADERFDKRIGDIEAMPYPDRFADGVIFSYVLGHVDIGLAMREARRVLRPGGWVFVYDIAAAGPLDPASGVLGYNIRTADQIAVAATAAGFRRAPLRIPKDIFLSQFFRGCFTQDELASVMRNVVPVIGSLQLLR